MDQWRIELYYRTEKFSPSLQLLLLSSIKVDQWGLIRDGVVWSPVRPSSEELAADLICGSVPPAQSDLKQFTVFTAPTKKFQATFLIRDKPELLSRGKTGIVHSARIGKSQMLHFNVMLWLHRMGLLAGDCLFIYILTVEVHLQAKLPAVSESCLRFNGQKNVA